MQVVGATQLGRCNVVGLILLFAITGCAGNQSLYRWGKYEAVIYSGYINAGSSDPVTDSVVLENDIRRTESEGLQVPPGVRIHLGYLYYSQGRDDEARAMFETERDLFPETEVFVNGLLERMDIR